MFETARIESKSNGWGFTSSLLLQCSLLSTVLLGSLLLPVTLPDVPQLELRLSGPKLPRHVRLVPTAPRTSAPIPTDTPRRFIYRPNTQATPSTTAAANPHLDFSGVPLVSHVGSSAGPGLGDHFAPTEGRVLPPPPPPPAPPAKTPDAPSRLRVGGNVLAAQILSRPSPTYPPLARQMRVEGVVKLHGVISREGRIIDLRVLSGHPLLVNAALAAVRQWTYRPTFLNGQAVEVEAPIEVRFVLGR
ncbi:MAG: energy transducer TonB [Bryobacter sp.]|nr:energy transducer TonB [Bryobacter sp.]